LTPADLHDLYERRREALLRRPSFGRSSESGQVRLEGAACEVTQGERRLAVDLAPEDGGAGHMPHPGELMRASIGASLALGYRIWGARLGVPIAAVEVDVLVEYDTRGQLGLADDVAVGWQRLLLDVRVASGATDDDVRRVVDMADRRSPMLANLSPSIERIHHLTIVRTKTRRA
jgi:uncharacterized OsmC-like protein